MKEIVAFAIATVVVSGGLGAFCFKALQYDSVSNLAAKALDAHDGHGENGHEEAHAGTPKHWAYSGEGGPLEWGSLEPKFSLCASGKTQSPINVTSSVNSADPAALKFFYRSAHVAFKNNGHTLQADINPGLYFERDGIKFELLQFHFHSPSEHKVDGVGTPLELHLVHKDTQGNLGVIGFMIDEGTENAVFAPVWSGLPNGAGKKQYGNKNIDLASLLPASVEHFNYSGSLTTPPCSEGVNWFVLKKHIQFSKEQIALYNAILSGTARPLQPLNARRSIYFSR